MEIGKTKRVVESDPIKDPVPDREPSKLPNVTPLPQPTEPVKEPDKVAKAVLYWESVREGWDE